jgi:Tol biopolymer transport system component
MQLTMERTRSLRPVLTVVTLALLLVALIATGLLIAGRLPSQMGDGAVVFQRGGDLFIADKLGGTPRPLVAGPERDSGPVFSPGGDRVAFVRHADPDGTQIMTVRSDGTGLTQLASGLVTHDVRLGWAPDGHALLASGSTRFDRGGMDIGASSHMLYLVASDGSGSKTVFAREALASGPGAWRPDGRHIAFLGVLPADGGGAAFIADADATNVRRLPLEDVDPDGGLAWSPDGTQLSFAGPKGISVVDIGAGGAIGESRQLADEVFAAEFGIGGPYPAWSPDGSNLAIIVWQTVRPLVCDSSGTCSDGDADPRVGIFESDGSGYRVVGPAVTGSLSAPAWSPDGRSLVITEYSLEDDSERTTWSLDLATGEAIEVQTPVDSWLHVAP